MRRTNVTAVTLLLGVLPALADPASVISTWYDAFGRADGAALAALLAPDAVIKLEDIGITQTKAEFIDSMGEWKAAIEGGSIRFKPDGALDGVLAYKVCYDFPDNDVMVRELFTLRDDLIVVSEQRALAGNCDGY